MSKENPNYFEKLNNINVSKHIEKKDNFSYLSWAYAWQELKKLYPDATYKVYENPEGFIYFHDNRTAWVKTGVTVEGLEHIEYLPIMDFKNKSIPVERITSFEINKAIQRSLTKAVARHGLGLYIYAGEDLPSEEDGKNEAKPIKKQTAKDKKDKYTERMEAINSLKEKDQDSFEKAESIIASWVNQANKTHGVDYALQMLKAFDEVAKNFTATEDIRIDIDKEILEA